MPAVTRKQYKGAAAQTTITNALGAGDTTITIAANTGWPSAAGVPFFVVISPGTASEEKCLTTISGTTLTLTRAQDDTSAQSHSSGASIYPVFAADDADEANLLASTLTTRGDLLTMGAGPDFARIGIGAADTVLKSDGTDVSYGTIVAANIASDAVTTAKILNANVTGAKLANADINDQTDDYSLVVGDRNKRVIMNKGTANTVTVDDSIFAAGDTIFIANKGAGVSTITAGAGVTINSASGLDLVTSQSGQLIALSASSFLFVASDAPAAEGGLTLITTGTMSAAASVTVDGCFTSTYDEYLLVFDATGSTSSILTLGMRNAGSTITAANYQRFRMGFNNNAATDNSAAGGATSWLFGFAVDVVPSVFTFNIYDPVSSRVSNHHVTGVSINEANNGASVLTSGLRYSTAQAMDGFIITVSAGTMTGTVRVYGLAK